MSDAIPCPCGCDEYHDRATVSAHLRDRYGFEEPDA